MKRIILSALALIIGASSFAVGREARLVRYPHYHNGRVVSSYLRDI